MADAFFVPFNEPVLAEMRSQGRVLLLVGIVLTAVAVVACLNVPILPFGNVAARIRMFVLMAAILSVGPLLGWAGHLSLSRGTRSAKGQRPALGIGEHGLLVGLVGGDPLFLTWSEIESIRTNADARIAEPATRFSIHFRRLEEVAERLKWADRYALYREDRLEFSMRLLGMPWTEIEEALAIYAPHWESSVVNLVRVERLKRHRSAKKPRRTAENYREVFRAAPLGSWGTAINTITPADCTIWFCADGTGGVSGREFEWREMDDWEIEVIASGETPITLTYSFYDDHQGVVARFGIDPYEDWIAEIGGESFTWNGLCWEDC